MKLIADSGSTKTTWALLDGQGLVSMYDSIGLNPRTTDDGWISRTMHDVALWVGNRLVDEVFFYGAGCGTKEARETMACYINERFAWANVHVDSDLMGACVATLGENEGLVGILGTGSNACYFDGKQITQRVPSLGFILGDEGSGNHIGRMLVKAYFEGSMPEELRQVFSQEYDLDYNHVISHLYSQSRPNAYLASFAPFASQNRSNTFIASLLRECFTGYFEHIVSPLGRGQLCMVGSVAWNFQEEIREVADSKRYTLDRVLRSPIEGIVKQF